MAGAVIIWERSNTTATPTKVIDDYISYQYEKGFNTTGDFILILPATSENFKAVSRTNFREKVVQFDTQYFGIIYKVNYSQESGKKRLIIKGRHLTSLLSHYMRGRPGLPGSKLKVYSSDVATDIEYYWEGAKSSTAGVNAYIASHYTDPDFWYPVTREIKFSKTQYVGNWESTGYFDSSWVNWLDYMESMSQREDFGFDVRIQDDGYMRLYLLSPETHDANEMVIATEFGDVASSAFEESSQQFYTHCTASGKTDYEGFMEVYQAQGEASTLDASQAKMYATNIDCSNMGSAGSNILNDFLNFQVQGFLSNHKLVRVYDATVNLKNLKYELGKDYELGDYIWLWDAELNVDVRAQLTAYTKTVSASEEKINPTFGFDQVGIGTILRRNGVI